MVKRIESLLGTTYQSMNGPNLTIAGFEEKIKSNNGRVSGAVFVAGGAEIGKRNEIGKRFEPLFIMDFKGSMNYDDKGIFSQNARVRTRVGTESMAAQVRYSPLSVDVPVGEKTNLYLNPHYSGQYDFMKNKWTNSAGIFGGVSQKVGDKVTLSLEVQRYNLQNIKDNSAQNWGVNAGVSVRLGN